MIRLPTDRTQTLPNTRCPYCGVELNSKNRSRDHVVARKFVPEGTLVNTLNIGLWSCRRCNGQKSALEDDISAITMMPGPDGTYARDDDRLVRTSQRKLRGSISADTRKKVADSHPKSQIRMPFGGAEISFSFTGQPRIDDERAVRLAWSHIQGLWFHQTYDKDRGFGRFLLLEKFALVGVVSRFDWGNVQVASFVKQIEDWEHQTFACLADGYFRAVVKGSPDGDTLAWAVEWNDAYRVFGYWSQGESWQSHFDDLAPLKPDHMIGDTTNGWASRREIPLPKDEDDGLFAHPPDFEDFPEETVAR